MTALQRIMCWAGMNHMPIPYALVCCCWSVSLVRFCSWL